MTAEPTLGGSFAWALWFLGEVAFKWVPGTVATLVGTGAPLPPDMPSPVSTIITSPVTAPEVVRYLQLASAPEAYASLFQQWSTFVALSLIFSLCLAALSIYCSIRVFQVRQLERRKFEAAQRTVVAQDLPKTQLRWSRVLEQAGSESEQNHRLAILEADIMLNELLDVLGYKGETMADKMRGVDRISFNTIDLAWEAHKIRNKIAHEGTAHPVSAREARRVIGLYEKVLKEFNYIA